MKHQQISVDFLSMVFTACSYLVLAGAVWIFLRLIQACVWLPRHFKKQNDVQRMLQDKVENYEKYILECEKREKSEQDTQGEDVKVDSAQAEKWKERRECLEMLKRELSKVRDTGDDSYDWDYLLKEEDEEAPKNEDVNIAEFQDNKMSKDELKDKVRADANTTMQAVGPEHKKDI